MIMSYTQSSPLTTTLLKQLRTSATVSPKRITQAAADCSNR